MDQYFNWHHHMSDATRVRFAKMRLLGQAKTYWTNVERLLTQRREEPISTWGEMKLKLRESTCHHPTIKDFWTNGKS